jgi:hypothetical protein
MPPPILPRSFPCRQWLSIWRRRRTRIREQPRLVDELGRLQVVEPTTERRMRELGDRLGQRERDIVADDGGDLEEALSS